MLFGRSKANLATSVSTPWWKGSSFRKPFSSGLSNFVQPGPSFQPGKPFIPPGNAGGPLPGSWPRPQPAASSGVPLTRPSAASQLPQGLPTQPRLARLRKLPQQNRGRGQHPHAGRQPMFAHSPSPRRTHTDRTGQRQQRAPKLSGNPSATVNYRGPLERDIHVPYLEQVNIGGLRRIKLTTIHHLSHTNLLRRMHRLHALRQIPRQSNTLQKPLRSRHLRRLVLSPLQTQQRQPTRSTTMIIMTITLVTRQSLSIVATAKARNGSGLCNKLKSRDLTLALKWHRCQTSQLNSYTIVKQSQLGGMASMPEEAGREFKRWSSATFAQELC